MSESSKPDNPMLADLIKNELYIFGDANIEYVGPDGGLLDPFERVPAKDPNKTPIGPENIT